MRLPNRYLVTVSIISVFFSVSCGGQKEKKSSKEIQQRINKVENNLSPKILIEGQDHNKGFILDRMEYHKVKGLSVAVIDNYKVDWTKNYGLADKDENRKVTNQTLFQAASLSKSLNAVGILKLVQEGKLDLNKDINQYLKSWQFPYDSLSNSKKITLTSLLSHTAGLSTPSFPGYAKGDKIPTITQILDGEGESNTKPVRSFEEPGLNYNYSGGGITISQLIVMNTTKQPYNDFMCKNVLQKIGMKKSTYNPETRADLATGYKEDGSEVQGKYRIYPELAAAGLWTNAEELAKFVNEILLSFKGESNKILLQKYVKLMFNPVLGNSGLGIILYEVNGQKYFLHGGANEGFRSIFIGNIDRGGGVVIMCNSDNGNIIDEIINSVAITYNWEGYYNPVIRKVVKVPDPVLKSYCGEYVDINGIDIKIELRNDGLWLTGPVQWKLYFTSTREFFAFESNTKFKFRPIMGTNTFEILADGKPNATLKENLP